MTAPTLIARARGQIEQLAPAGERVVVKETGNGRSRVAVYERASGQLARELVAVDTLGYFGGSIALGATGRTVFSTFVEGRVDELELETGKTVRSIAVPPLVGDRGETFAGRADHLLVSSEVVYVVLRGEVYAWRLDAGTLDKLPGFAFASGAHRIVSSHGGNVLWLDGHSLDRFDVAAGTSSAMRFGEESSTDLAFLVASDRIATATYDGRVKLWTTAAAPALEQTVRVGPDAFVIAQLVPLRGGTLFAVSCADHRISVLARGDAGPRARLGGLPSPIGSLAPAGDDELWVGDRDGGIWRIDLTGEAFATAPPKKAPKLRMTNHEMPGWGSHARLVRTAGGIVSIGGVYMSKGGTRDLCAWRRGETDAIAYRAFKNRKLGYTNAVSLGGAVAIDDGSNVLVVDATTLETVKTLAHKKLEGLAASPDGTRLVTTSATELKLWRTDTWEIVEAREGEVPRCAKRWLDGEGLVLFTSTNDSFGLLSPIDLKRRATKRFGPLDAIIADARGTVIACVVNAGTEMKPSLRIRCWNAVTDATFDLPPEMRSPAFGDGVLGAVDEHGAYVATYDFKGAETKRVALPSSRAGMAATEAKLAMGGRWAAVVVATVMSRADPFPEPNELAVIDLATGAVVMSQTVAGTGPMLVDGDDLVIMTSAGRVEWLPLA